jgi:hypothetical protein
MNMLRSLSIAAVIVLAACPARASAPHEVVLTVVHSQEQAQRAILRAASVLDYPIDWDTAFDVPARRSHLGPVITAHRTAANRIAVTSYLSQDEDVGEQLRAARRAFPGAKSVAVTLPPDATDEFYTPYVLGRVLVVSSHRSYAAAVRAAKSYGHEAGIPYDTRGMVFDDERGLIWPDNDEDDIWAGQYAPRRDDTAGCPSGCVTVERSSAYTNFEPGLYIVVAGIVDREEARERLTMARRYAPYAYVKQTVLYMGCMH